MELSALDKLKSFLGSVVRIRITDGRVIEGELQCMDKDLNFMLGSAIENHGVAPENADFAKEDVPVSRYLGLAMIPGAHVVSVHLCEASAV